MNTTAIIGASTILALGAASLAFAPSAHASSAAKWQRAGNHVDSSQRHEPVARGAKKTGKAGKSGKRGSKLLTDAAGARVFKTLGCPACHSVAKKGIAKSTPNVVKGGPDLSTVGRRFKKKRALRAWLHQTSRRRGKKHPVMFAGSQRQFDTLASWLLRLR